MFSGTPIITPAPETVLETKYTDTVHETLPRSWHDPVASRWRERLDIRNYFLNIIPGKVQERHY